MRKVIVFNSVSVDGYYAGPNDETNWFVHDLEVNRAAHEMMSPDTILFGRTTYQLFESYWPHVLHHPDVPEDFRTMADELNQMTKVVFSRTLGEAQWENSILFNANPEQEVKKLKRSEGADIAIFGSGTIVHQLENEGLIDEYLLAVTPIILGKGKPLFQDVEENKLELLATRSFRSGMVLLHYRTNHP